MLRRFEDEPTRPNRAYQVWLILIGAAAHRRTVTYGDLAGLLGYKAAGVFAQTLGHIMFYCRQNGLPPLTAIVIRDDTHRPGTGLGISNPLAARDEVFAFDWYSVFPPCPAELAEAWRKAGISRQI